MRRSQIYLIAVLLLAIVTLFGFQYIFSIYEVEIDVNPAVLFADNTSVCEIRTVPLNSFGARAPFRTATAAFEIREGKDLVEILMLDEEKGIMKLKAGNKTGTVVILIRTEKALLPAYVEIRINPNAV